MRFERFKKNKWCKFICYLVLFAFMLEIPMPAYAASTGNSAVVQSDSEEKDAAAGDDNGTTVKSADTTGATEETNNITDGSPTSSNDAAETTNNLQNLLNGGMDGGGLNAETILGSANSSTGEDENAALVPTTEKEIITELPELRESNVKYFLNTDGTQTASVYDHDVHYLAGDGTYQDIDNSLKDTETAGGKEILTNEENSADFTLAKDADQGNLVSINKDGYNLKWRLLSAEDSQAQDTTVATNGLMNSMTAAEDPACVTDTVASAEYNGILKNVNLEYVLVGSELKENITLSSAKVPSQFSFVLTASSSLFAKESEGQITFENADGETVFHMSEALMYDAKGAESTDISVKLAVISETADSHQYKLTITPSAAWLKDEARVYPVVLDPTISTTQSSATISDAHVNSEDPNGVHNTSTLVVGTNSSGSSRTYLKFTLPTQIQKSDRIVSAELGLCPDTSNSYSIFSGSQISAAPTMYMFAPSADWNPSTLTWSNQPGYVSMETIDYSKIDIVNGVAKTDWYTWDVTSLVDRWYNGAANYGVMIKDTESTQYSKRAYFYSSNLSGSSQVYPIINIAYMNMIGLEDYWTYHTQSAGLAGNGYVNDFTGGLTASFNDYSWDSEILSLSVSHVYNSDNYNKAQTSLDVGYGYMLSIQESITPVTVNGISLYKYVDGDGTQHYFQYSDSKWTDDSGLGLTLTINTDDYTVKDKSDNLRVFYKNTGNLHFIQDNDGNKITLSYSGNNMYLDYVDDSAGHRLTFNYDSSHRLQWITAKETAHDDVILAQIFYTYDSGGHLTQAKFPGKSTVSSSGSSGAENIAQFGYAAGGTLNKLTDTTNGMSVDYTYDYFGSNSRPRVTTFNVYNSGGGLESSYAMTYPSHCTKFTETKPNLGRSQVYVFNYMGQTISAQDQDGNALFCETGLSGGAKNKVTFASKAQQSITNLIKNHDFENGVTDYDLTGTIRRIDTVAAVTGSAFYGTKSLKVTKTSASYISTFTGACQSVTVNGGKSYTLSAYVKTSGCSTDGADIKLEALSGSTVVATAETDKIVSESGYLRFDTTIDLTSLSSSQTYTLKAYFGLKNVTATAYFDSVQLEVGACANRYNLLENSNLENGTTSWSTDGTTSDDTLVTGVTRDGKGSCYQFKGDATVSKKLYQEVPISGKSGDSYVFGCWVRSTGLANKDTGDGTKQCLGMTIKFSNTDGTDTYKSILITPTSSEWQYVCNEAIAAKDYSKITVYLKFVFNRNNAWFDDAQLYKDSFGESFTYDSKGNVISVVDKAKNTASAAVNSTDDTTSYSDGKGQTYNFVYNGDNNLVSTKHNLTQSTAPDGTSSTFIYDDFGNVTQTDQRSKWDVVSRTITSTVSYTDNGAYKTASTDQRNLETTYNYDQKYSLLTSTTIPVGSSDTLKTTNTYDTATRKVTQINAIINTTDFGTALNYSYVQNRPSSIQIGNAAAYLKYGYAYDSSGNMTSVTRSSSGNATPVTLESYGYIAGRGLKGSQTYGNGQTLNYTYDSQDRLIGVINGTKQVGKYFYDGNGLLGKALSYDINGTLFNTTTNQYDLADRLISSANSKGSGIYNVSYDKNNLATGYISYLRDGYANLEYTTQYAYNEFPNSDDSTGVDKPKTDSLKIGSTTLSSTSFGYDYFGRNTSMLASAGTGDSHIKVGYAYLNVGDTKTTTLPSRMAVRYTTVPNSNEAPDYAYNFSYDRSGNITNILTEVKDGSSYTKTYGYDALSRLTAAGNVANSGDNYAYTYDGRNNLTGSTVTNNGTTTQTKSYTYATDDIDRLASFSHTTAAGTVTRSYTCDSVGNPTAITETNTATNTTRNVALTWTQGKLLNSVSDNAGLSNTYTYDADGNVAKKVVAGGSYVVYHYSDGSLEYEEHFNASGTLQEVLKYSYDADGNVEYLLYKNDNFSTAGAYDLYYYVRNATGDITDLFQVRAKSGSSTTVVNRLAAHYEYDPYGNILSINKYNNDPIGDINPIRYKDYYYDIQTGWYQLGSRFYDPEVGRFLNADDVSLLMETDSGVVDKNLYAYCDGNPVMRKDDGGEFWQIAAALIGGVIGGGFEIATQMIAEHRSFSQLDWKSIGISAASGAVTAVCGPLIGTAVSVAATAGQDIYEGVRDHNSATSVAINTLADCAVTGALSYTCGGGISAGRELKAAVKSSGFRNGIAKYTSEAHNKLQKSLTAVNKAVQKRLRRWHVTAKSIWGFSMSAHNWFYSMTRRMN